MDKKYSYYIEKYEERKEFMKNVKAMLDPMYQLLLSWEKLSSKDNDETSVNVPFSQSFDEFYAEYVNWAWNLNEKFLPKTETFYPTITVGDMKKILAVLDDDVQIVISKDEESWWLNINSVELPDGDGMFTLTLHPKDNFDTRQF